MNYLLTTNNYNINVIGLTWSFAAVLIVLIVTIAATICIVYGIYRHSLKEIEKLSCSRHEEKLKDADTYESKVRVQQ